MDRPTGVRLRSDTPATITSTVAACESLKQHVATSRRLATRTKELSKSISKSSKRSQIALEDAE